MSDGPLISCLCITKNNAEMLHRAIGCFLSQTYTNKELLVIFENDNRTIEEVIKKNTHHQQVRFIEMPVSPKCTLGELKNKAIALSDGEYFCQWDDDDWYACDRLQIQMDMLLKSAAQVCFLGHWIFYDCVAAKAYLSFRRNWEGSILCKKDIVNGNCRYALLAKLEDTPFVNKISEMYVTVQVIKPSTYIYIYHGNNTWDYEHFSANFDKGQQMSAAYSQLIADILKGIYSGKKALEMLDSEKFNEEVLAKISTSKIYG